VNPLAIRLAATSTLVLDRSTTLRARTFDGTNWSALDDARFVVGRAPGMGDLAISELYYHPGNPTEAEREAGYDDPSAFEFIELVNTTDQPLDLRGLRFSRGLEFDWSESALDTLAAGECVLVVADRDAFRLRYGTNVTDRVAGVFANGTRLSNGGERLTVVDGATNALVDLTYHDTYPWPESPDGQGPTLVLEDLRDPADPARWRASLLPGGTPGEVTSLAEEWRRLHFTAAEQRDLAVSGERADPDGDGLDNLLELAFGSDPRHPDPAGGRLTARIERTPEEGLPRDFLVLRFRRPAGGSPEVAVETSPELTTWTRGEAHLTLTALERDPGGIWETVECRTLAPLPAEGQARAYWRLKVTPRP
jgi:hypothetical protein